METVKTLNGYSPEQISILLKRMDTDLAVQFVLSGVSLNTKKMIKTFGTMCSVMEIRLQDKIKNKYINDGTIVNKKPGAYTTLDSKKILENVDTLLQEILGIDYKIDK